MLTWWLKIHICRILVSSCPSFLCHWDFRHSLHFSKWKWSDNCSINNCQCVQNSFQFCTSSESGTTRCMVWQSNSKEPSTKYQTCKYLKQYYPMIQIKILDIGFSKHWCSMLRRLVTLSHMNNVHSCFWVKLFQNSNWLND